MIKTSDAAPTSFLLKRHMVLRSFGIKLIKGLPRRAKHFSAVTLLGLSAVALFSISFAAAFHRGSRPAQPSSNYASNSKMSNNGALRASYRTSRPKSIMATGEPAPAPPDLFSNSVLPAFEPLTPFFTGEPVATYASDCTTQKSSFSLGETVCAKVTGAPIGSRLAWVTPFGLLASSTTINSSSQTVLFTLPTDVHSIIAETTVDNRGTWIATLLSRTDSSVRASARFSVSDPAVPTTDLSITQTSSANQVSPGSSYSTQVFITNDGPDKAHNVTFTNPVPVGMTFISSAQNSGPAFSCTNPGASSTKVECTISDPATFDPGVTAVFTLTFEISSTVSGGTVISNVASVSSTTAELTPLSNTSTADVIISGPPAQPGTCTLTCPGDITQDNDPGQNGAIVNYPSPAISSSSCVPVTCDHPSGSFFPVGQTPVTCTSPANDSCSFNVTVTNTRALSITLNGDNPMGVECHGSFTDPGATATNAAGDVPVTTSGTVDANTPGTYTITYTATDGTNTVTATRTVDVVDTAPPIITLNGNSPMTVECHTSFTDPGATAFDACSQSSAPVTVQGTVDVNTPGVYTLTYRATDGGFTVDDNGNTILRESIATRIVNVVDTTAPTLTLIGGNTLTVECHSSFTDPGATATDGCAGNLTSAITVSGSVNPNIVGSYTLTYAVSDGTNQSTATRTVNVVDTTAPTITLNGAATVTVECHTGFTDPGATASDACAGDLTSAISVSGTVNTNVAGVYTLTYSVSDGTNTTTAKRTVNVVDTTPPTITLNGASTITIECHTTFTDPGATATDGCAGNLTSAITVSGNLNTNAVGSYTLTYSVSDGTNTSTTTRTVNVIDTTPPTISLTGSNPMTVECHTTFTDPGAAASDSCAGNLAVTVSGTVNTDVPGTYTRTYSATDPAGNTTTVTRTVNVVDTTAPVITLKSAITLWPPNHKYVTINLSDIVQSVADGCDSTVSISNVYITKVTSDEAENAPGSGNTLNDAVIAANCKSVQLRGERSGSGNGRVYSITLKVKDASGNVGTAVFKVRVPLDANGSAVEDAPQYTVTSSCP